MNARAANDNRDPELLAVMGREIYDAVDVKPFWSLRCAILGHGPLYNLPYNGGTLCLHCHNHVEDRP